VFESSLVESGSHKQDYARKGSFFAGTLIIYVVLLLSAFVALVYAYDASLNNQNMELLAELAPPVTADEPPPPPEPEQQQRQAPATQPEVAMRTQMLAPVDAPNPPREVSVVRNTVAAIPRTGAVLGNRDADPVSAGGPVGPTTSGGGPPGPPAAAPPGAPPPPPPPPKPTPPPRRAPISKGVLTGSATSRVTPPYPAAARAANIAGTVVVQITVDESGKVVSASAVSGPGLLRQAAVQASYGWRFSPTQLSGQPVKVTGTISFNFTP